MDAISIIIPLVIFAGFIYVWYRVFKWVVKFFKNVKNIKGDSSDKFVEEQSTQKLSGKFDYIVQKLEVDRLAAKKKTKGLFKRSFLRTWGIMGGTAIILVVTLTEGEIDPVAIIGPSVMTAFLAAIGAGIYTAIKKANNRSNFVRVLKKELVTEIVKHVNPGLTFYDEGISKEGFTRAELFYGNDFRSEDTIKGSIDGQNVVISECESSSTTGTSDSRSTHTYFNGIFVQLNLSKINVSTPLKIIPTHAIEESRVKKLVSSKIRYERIKINEEDKIVLDTTLKKSNYEFFCADKQVAESFINETTLKVLDFIFDKYENEKESLFKDIPLLEKIKRRSGVYISMVDDKLYLALDWDQDMFEPDAFLNNNLVESGIAQSIYKDLLFINQVVKEVNLLNKVNG